jgi:hypothetical protein
MGNQVRIIASQTHTRLPNEWRFCPISIPMGQFLSHTRTLIGEFPMGWRYRVPIDISSYGALVIIYSLSQQGCTNAFFKP